MFGDSAIIMSRCRIQAFSDSQLVAAYQQHRAAQSLEISPHCQRWMSCLDPQVTVMTSPHAAPADDRIDPATMADSDHSMRVALTAEEQSESRSAPLENNDAFEAYSNPSQLHHVGDDAIPAKNRGVVDASPAEDQAEIPPANLEFQSDAPARNSLDDAPSGMEGVIEHPTAPQQSNGWNQGFGEPAIPDEAHLENYPQPVMFPLRAITPMEGLVAQSDYTQMFMERAERAMALGGVPADQPLLQDSPFPHDAAYQDTTHVDAITPEQDKTRVKAFAKLQFDDSEVYINTYQLILGRDLAAARAAARREGEGTRRLEGEPAGPQEPKAPAEGNREGSSTRRPKSVISETAGILRDEDISDNDYQLRRRKSRRGSKKSKSTASSSRLPSRRNSIVQANAPIYATQPSNHEAGRGDPSPFGCPTVHIHPPAAAGPNGFKPISRKHVKIAYNPKNGLWEASIIGRNGAFIDEEFHHDSKTVPLKSGSVLQIGTVCVRFLLPNVPYGHTGAEAGLDYEENHHPDRYSEGGKEMSFDFEDTRRDGAQAQDTSDESSSEEEAERFDDQDEAQDNADDIEDEDEELENSDPSRLAADDQEEPENEEEIVPETLPQPPKRKGPGRPPKNGIMSKREQQLLKKQALAQQQAALEQPTTTKNKVGRPRKHPRPDTPPLKTEKRKYTKRKPKEPRDPNQQDGSGSEDKPKEKKEKKPPKPPRSPSPVFNESDLSPEQLAKPTANYVTLIHEALTNSAAGEMSLPQIYRAIQRKYPFFVLKCSTNGWQSSVRHNLSQHHAFRKVRRDGKGWMWAVVEGVSIEKEKKRRLTPPPQMAPGHMQHQPIYPGQHPAHIMPGHPPYVPGMMPPPGYSMGAQGPPQMRPGQPLPYIPGGQLNGNSLQPGIQSQIHAIAPPVLVPPTASQAPGQAASTYSSPYASKPAATTPATVQTPDQQSKPESRLSNPPAITAMPQSQQSQPPPAPARVKPNDVVLRAVDTFRANLVKTLKEKTSNAEAVVGSAINRVLGYTLHSSVPGGDSHEDMIISALRTMLGKIPGSNVAALTPPQAGTEPQPRSYTPQAHPNGTATAAARPPFKAPSAEKFGSSVKRPSVGGQAPTRPAGQSVSRPPMMGTSMKRTNSGSPAFPRPSTASSASPAPTPASSNGSTAALKPALSETGQVAAGQKRPLEDAEDGREFKRIETSGLAQVKT